MPKKKRGPNKLEDLTGEHFTYKKTAVHGFPTGPSALAYEPDLRLLAIGTTSGELRVYGRPGVEFSARMKPKRAILKIFTFGNLHQFLTVASDNSISMWIITNDEDGRLSLRHDRRYELSTEAGKNITSCCVSGVVGYVHIGTDGGNVYTLDLKSFELTNDVIFWNNATALAQPAAQTHPGAVKSLELCPTDPNKLLIGYELGLIALWDLENTLPTRNYPGTMTEQLTPVEALAWHPGGRKFMSSHSNGIIMSWNEGHNSKDERLPVNRYGDNCCPITKLSWLDSESDPMVVFSGGLPEEASGDHHTVSIHHGANAVALAFTSEIVGFVTISHPVTHKGEVLLILAQYELLAFDLTDPKCPILRQPYLHPLNSSNVTTMKVYQNCSQALFDKLKDVSKRHTSEKYSQMEWPVMGGFVKDSVPKTHDILITGHENGSVKFWDVTTMGQVFLFEVATASVFDLPDDGSIQDEDQGDGFLWPPYRKVGQYDPFSDDQRLAITILEFCMTSHILCIGGTGGQVLLFTLANTKKSSKIEALRADIIPKGDVRYNWRGEGPLPYIEKVVEYPPGFQLSFLMQLGPPAPISAMDFTAHWGVIAVGSGHGFTVGNYLLHNVIITHCTLQEDGSASHSLTRVQSIRRSLRNSFRRRSTRQDRRTTLEQQQQKQKEGSGKRKQRRTGSEPSGGVSQREAAASNANPPSIQAAVTHICLADTFLGGEHHMPCLVASTMGSVLIRYYLQLPPTGDRISEPSIAMLAGKDYTLLHGAPVISVFILDNNGLPIPSGYEQDNNIAPAPSMVSPHYGIIVTEEQIKIIHLPSLKLKRKEKVTNEIHERIKKAFIIRANVLAPPDSPRDWHAALIVFTNYGTALVYSVPQLVLCCIVKNFVDPNDIRAQRSITVSKNGEVFHLSSFSEIQRCLFCAYNGSFHVSMKPALASYEGSTKPLPARPRPDATPPASQPSPQVHTREAVDEDKVTVEIHEPKDSPAVEPDPPARKPEGNDKLLKEAEEYLKKTQTKITDPIQMDDKLLKSQNHYDSTTDSSSSSSSDSDDDIDIAGEETIMGNPMAMGFEDDQSGKQLDNIIESSLQELNNARKFYQEMQARAKKTGD